MPKRSHSVFSLIRSPYDYYSDMRIIRLTRFGLVGASGALVNIGALVLLVNLFHVPVLIAGAIAIEVSIISNFFLNHHYTFGNLKHVSHKNSHEQLLGKLIRYNLVTIGGAAISYLVFALSYRWLGLHYILADILAILIAMGWNYYMSVRLVWKIVDE